MTNKLKEYDLTPEEYREYEFNGYTYRIANPVKLFLREDGEMHRVLDSNGVVHCLPSPGKFNCVLRWKSKDPNKPVNF